MWEKKSSGEFVRTTEKAVRKIADKKSESIERTAEWMKKYQYAEWPANPDRIEPAIRAKVLAAVAEEVKQDPAFTAWVVFQVAGELAENLEVRPIWG
jgi:hypothetical protein